MILTDITVTKEGRFALFIDEEFKFSIAPELYYANQLHIGDSLEESFLESLRGEAMEKKAKEKALSLLSYKEYTGAELEKKLRNQVGDEAASLAVERMEELGLVNDTDYANRYAKALSRKGYGQRRISMEMRRKGLSKEDIDGSIEQLDVDPAEQAAAFLEKKYPLWREDSAVKRRAFSALTRRGFGYEDIRRAMGNLEYDE